MNIELSVIPTTPGVYMFKDAQGRIIYVGKAKHLRRRVSSYFRSTHRHSPKTTAMLATAQSLDTLSTNTEKEALLLEASLIKKHRPRYNVVLRDDKQYLLFYIDKTQPFPRLSMVRPRLAASRAAESDHLNNLEPEQTGIVPGQIQKAEGVFYGPYTSALAARETWRVIHRIFPLRRCTRRSFKNRVRPCLYYHLGQCLAPCVLPVEQAEYGQIIQRVEMFLSGRSSELLEQLQQEMLRASDELNFEQAAKLRDQIAAVRQTLEKQSAVLHGAGDLDVIGLARIHSSVAGEQEKTEDCLGLGILFVRQGQVLGGKTFYWPGLGLEEGAEALLAFMTQFYDSATMIPGRILIPWDLPPVLDEDSEEMNMPGANLSQAAEGVFAEENSRNDLLLIQELLSEKRGGAVYVFAPRNELEKRLVDMAATNAREGAVRCARTDMGALLAAKFGLAAPVERIEAVDVSHTAGRETRVGMVVYENGHPLRDQFRAYTIKDQSIVASDDYAALAHWAKRRAGAGPPWPDLLLIDGGRGQLAAVDKALTDAGVTACFALAAIAKARTEEGRADRRAGNEADRIFVPGRANPLNIRPGSAEMLFLQMIRDAVHDHAIGRHRRARSKAALAGELVRLPGVGPKTAKLLWDNFNSLQEMAAASEAELAALPGIGKNKAARLHQELQKFR